MGDGPSHCAGCALVHLCIFLQHKDGGGLAKDQKVPRPDPATLTKENAWLDITNPPADPRQHLSHFYLQGQLGFHLPATRRSPGDSGLMVTTILATRRVAPPLPAGLVSAGKNILAQSQ